MTTRSAATAIEAAVRWLAAQDAPESVIARHEAGAGGSLEDARRWVRWILDEERNGAWADDLLETARALLTLREIREAASLKEQDPAIGRALDWVRSRKGRPGAWTDGCAPDRHGRGLCHHFAAGFFSPGPSTVSRTPALPSGAATATDAEARFCVSAVALRCVLRWQDPRTDERLHLEAIRRVVALWPERPPEGLTTTALVTGARALLSSRDPRDRDAAAAALERVAGAQRADGSWADTDPFHAIAAFHAAVSAGVGGARVENALAYGAGLLMATQREDGSWGPEHGPRRALIGVRALRRSTPRSAG